MSKTSHNFTHTCTINKTTFCKSWNCYLWHFSNTYWRNCIYCLNKSIDTINRKINHSLKGTNYSVEYIFCDSSKTRKHCCEPLLYKLTSTTRKEVTQPRYCCIYNILDTFPIRNKESFYCIPYPHERCTDCIPSR